MVYQKMLTQWRVGANGRTGMDYNALPAVLRFSKVPEDDWPDVFDDVRVMEYETLSLIASRNERNN
jgi:hypothetical protein